MITLVDTPVWSLALRRRTLNKQDQKTCDEFSELIKNSIVGLIGTVRQEILTGIKDTKMFKQLRDRLNDFHDVPFEVQDFEMAAHFSNLCRGKGIQGSPTDYLLCAVSVRFDAEVFTTDKDFQFYAKYLNIKLR
jgi:predicted nucleic acid-binding protein